MTIDRSVSVIGSIYPDGTLAPDDGLADQLTVALAHGAKRVGYPAGARPELVAIAKQRGAQAIALVDVHAAYALLTGTPLPAPVPVGAADMALDDATVAALDASYKQWQAQLAVEWGAILQLESAGRLPARLVELREAAKRDAGAAEQLHRKGLHAAAAVRMRAAAVHARAANRIYDVLSAVQNGKLDVALAVLGKLDSVDDATRTALARIAAVQPTTLGAHLQMLAASRDAVRARRFAEHAIESLAAAKAYVQSLAGTGAAMLGSGEVADAVVAQVGPPILDTARTVAEVAQVTEQLALPSVPETPHTASLPQLLRVAGALDAGGAPSALRDAVGAQSLTWALLSLAADQLAAIDDARPIAKRDDKSLASTLAAAERTARASARAARVATGAISAQAKVAYQLGRTLEHGSRADRLEALAHYWTATQLSHAAVLLARN